MFTGIRHTKLFRAAAKLALFAILLQALLPLLHHPAQAAEAFPAGLHICSVVHHVPGSVDQDKDQTAKEQCPICFSLHLLGSGYVQPSGGVVITALQTYQTIFATDDEFSVRPFVWPGIGSRAPPAFA